MLRAAASDASAWVLQAVIEKAVVCISLAALLSSCSTTKLDADFWDNKSGECAQREELHRNGIWDQQCRDGKGVLIWLVFTC